MIVDIVSDLHGFYPEMSSGDLLIMAGDLTARDDGAEYLVFREWLRAQNYKKKIFIAGNHDNKLQNGEFYFSSDWMGAEYICDSGIEFEGLKLWGSPWTKTFPGMNPKCKAFTVDTEKELAKKWTLIPDDTDILITHSPPYGIKDKTIKGEFVGSNTLAYKIGCMTNPPKLWVWGHVHEAYGRDLPIRGKPCIMINASHVNERYEPVNKPIRVIL